MIYFSATTTIANILLAHEEKENHDLASVIEHRADYLMILPVIGVLRPHGQPFELHKDRVTACYSLVTAMAHILMFMLGNLPVLRPIFRLLNGNGLISLKTCRVYGNMRAE
ncbi:MAG: hypothetical protein U5N55_12195 [Cypionkella sp.]|nr:hypothetical protein [Cypionkella sp.]